MPGARNRQQRLADLRGRLANPQDPYERCRVYPCANGTTADRGEGLNRLYCRKHIEFYRRHGSYVKRSYGAGELRPYRVEALAWLRAHGDDQSVRLAIAGVQRLYNAAGTPVEAFRLPGKSPGERARATWAQLRKREIDPLDVLAAWLAVDLRLRDDPQPDRHDEYRHVQVAKLIHRMAGGTHKRWECQKATGQVDVTEFHKHPISRGRVLRVLGRELAMACRDLTGV
ncbi:hypothetical protein [Rhodanobacter sp. MP1X3]|uniref:hypothetical protein n=1 Tax=Rhodanobacter sp. MP1X3 TaxID=2723086 RepID=UPI0016116F4F|nr:hypothetical protein [Rhodanobacter sp. MP1X3]MBB6241259.1 hypothetical protein [Rhodanobacter sp. MP1X3]